MTELKKIYLFIKNYPYAVIIFQLLLNILLIRLIFIESDDRWKFIEMVLLSINTIRLILNPLMLIGASHDSEAD